MGRKEEANSEGHGQMMLTDDVIQWMQKKKYDEVMTLAEDRNTWSKMTPVF